MAQDRFAIVLAAAVAGTILLATFPFRWVMTILIVASGFTQFEVTGLPVHLRADIVIVPAALLSCAWNGRLKDLFRWLHHPVMLLLAGYVAVQFAVSLLLSPDPSKSVSVATWLMTNLIIVALALACFGDERRALMARLAVTAAVVVCSGLVGWLYVRYLGGTWGAGYDPDFGLRANGVAYEPNILAGTAAIWVVILLTKGGRLRLRDWAFLLSAIAVIPLTTTRAAPIAVLAGLLVYFVRDLRKVPRIALVAGAALATITVVQIVAPDSWTTITAKLFNFGDQTAAYRKASWQLALSDLHGWNWLFGLGTNSYGQRHLDPTLLAQQVPAYLGNLPLQTLYDSGAAGLVLLLAAGGQLVRSGARGRRLAVMVAFLVISSATSPFFFGNWWLLIALGLAGQRRWSENPAVLAFPLLTHVGGPLKPSSPSGGTRAHSPSMKPASF